MLRGVGLILFSALCFALATVFAKYVNLGSSIPGIEVSFFRFIVGFVIFAAYVAIRGKSLKPNKPQYILSRSVFNTIAVMLLFVGVQYSTVSKANMLNMTYPVFVFFIAPLITGERSPAVSLIYLLLTMVGLYLVIIPGDGFAWGKVNIGDVSAFLSALVAGFAISYLRIARKFDESYMIMFYLMLFGSLLNGAIALPFFVAPTVSILGYLLLSALCGVVGQLTLTAGYKFIDANRGALVSSSNIVFAGLLGMYLFNEPVTPRMIIGAVLIFVSIYGVNRGNDTP